MKTVGLVVPAVQQGGGVPSVARFVLGVAQRAGYRVQVISLATSSRDSESTCLSAPSTWLRGVSRRHAHWHGQHLVHVGAAWTDLEFQRYQPREALSAAVAGCDLLQVVAGFPAWANAVVGLGRPVALNVATRAIVERRRRDAAPRSPMGWWRKGMTAITDRLDDQALCAVDAVQLMNPWMLQYTQKINAGRKAIDIRYAPPGVDGNLFSPTEERMGSVSANAYILCVGRLDDVRKNISMLLAAFAALPARLAHVHLVTAGSGKPSPEYWAQVRAMGLVGRVRHIDRPETTDLVKLYQHANACALSSDEEGFGMVILEAMACGVPVVATRCGGPDGIITDGKDGFLVPVDDRPLMADRLTLLCEDLQLNRAMGLEARKTVEERYAEDVAGQAFVDVWGRLLKRAGTF